MLVSWRPKAELGSLLFSVQTSSMFVPPAPK
jgi:hypothetical protein